MRITKAQQRAILHLYQRDINGTANYMEFRRRFRHAVADSCILGHWCGMWIGIESDGYTHS